MVITMSKQNKHNEVTNIYKLIIKNKCFDKSLFEIVNENITDSKNEVYIINEIIKKLNNNNYEIESINPLKIKEI